MALNAALHICLIVFGICGICTGSVQDTCSDYKLQFERVFSVPGDMAMLNSTLLSPDVFDFKTVPYNITWYELNTGRQLSNQTGRILIRGETLWFLNVTLDDMGQYVSIVRTPSQCYRQATMLKVDVPTSGQCGRPVTAGQTLKGGVFGDLNCPLRGYIHKLNSYNLTYSLKWYRGCDAILNENKTKYIYRDQTKLLIKVVKSEDNGFYTCTLNFTLDGVMGSVSETIELSVKEDYHMVPQVREPANEIIKAQMGSNFSRRCLVFVPGVGTPFVDIMWLAGDNLIFHPGRIYASQQRMWIQEVPNKGVWLERTLVISNVWEDDFYIKYTCRAYSSRGNPDAFFTLLPEDPNIIILIGSLLSGVMLLFIISVTVYYIYKVDIVLWFRRTFPVLYTNKDLDGKLYDAYVAYPQPYSVGFSKEVEEFALHKLPQVLENACGYKLFIAGRDCLPGQAVFDSVEENIQASRRLLLLYTASTFVSKSPTSSTSSNNNNVCKSSYDDNNRERKTSDDSSSSRTFDCDEDEVYPDTRQQLECMAAMHRALLEGSLKVILVELEEISPAQLALFPESVRHLRKKQGAVCWWKNPETRQMWRSCRTEDEEKGGQGTSLSPTSRFWKEVRYHMPVRGKRDVYPEKTALLNL